ncbi:MAG: ATP-binding cassette domain-containing protein [Eubacteriaceae bacterium]|nr:ATP-binding cassette domain-containing protein [Eubacteriaceae bacterium]
MQIAVNNLSFAYPGRSDPVFSKASFSFDTSWKLGLIGRNGRGKTTLLKILSGELEGYGGSITGNASFEYFPYPVDNEALSLSCLDALRRSGCEAEEWELIWEFSLIGLRGSALENPYSSLSLGEQAKALLCALFLKSGSFMLIDEPTNHLDLQSREHVGKYLASKEGFILASHDRSLLDSSVDHILSINKTTIELQKGNFGSWQQNRENMDNYDIALNKALKSEIKRLEAASRQTAGWAGVVESRRYGSGLDRGYVGHKSAKMMKRSKVVQKRQANAIAQKESLLKDVEQNQSLLMFPLRFHSDLLISANEAGMNYSGTAGVQKTSFEIRRDERLAVIGSNGSGKSTILKLACGILQPSEGRISIAKNLKISYVPQGTSHLKGTLSEWAAAQAIDLTVFLTNLDKLGVNNLSLAIELEGLSEGEKKKALIAASLSTSAHLYIWDEPLNYLDIYTRIQIENAILAAEPAMLVVEHDKEFIESIATSSLSLS